MLYIGLDVHLKSSGLCVVDEHGKKVQQSSVQGPRPVVVATDTSGVTPTDLKPSQFTWV